MRAGIPGRIVAFGRDLRAVSSLQRRLVDAQQSMERDYVRIRHVETRYRLLFQMASDAVLIVDDAAHKVMDSNPAARRLFARSRRTGAHLAAGRAFTADTARGVDLLLAGRAGIRTRRRRARTVCATASGEVVVTASLFRDEGGASAWCASRSPPANLRPARCRS